MPFHPCVDGELLTAAPAAALAAGAGADVPLLAGTTSEEMNLFLGFTAPVQRDRLVGRVARYVGVDEATSAAVVERYAAEVGIDGVWPALFTDVEMQIPLRRVLTARANAAAAPTFAYLFTWSAPERGAFHAVDIPFTFDAFDVDGWGEFVGFDADADRLGRELRTAWAGFARVTATPAGSRIPRPTCSDASRSTPRATRCSTGSRTTGAAELPARERAPGGPPEDPFDVGRNLVERAARDRGVELHRRVGEPGIESVRDHGFAPGRERRVQTHDTQARGHLVTVECLRSGDAERTVDVVGQRRRGDLRDVLRIDPGDAAGTEGQHDAAARDRARVAGRGRS